MHQSISGVLGFTQLLVCISRTRRVAKSEVRGKRHTDLHKMAKRIKAGGYIPPPRVKVEKL